MRSSTRWVGATVVERVEGPAAGVGDRPFVFRFAERATGVAGDVEGPPVDAARPRRCRATPPSVRSSPVGASRASPTLNASLRRRGRHRDRHQRRPLRRRARRTPWSTRPSAERADGVAAHAEAPELPRDGAGQADHALLRRRVRDGRRVPEARPRARVDDRPRTLTAEVRRRFADHGEVPLEVHADGRGPTPPR